jgi:hypothetical protein
MKAHTQFTYEQKQTVRRFGNWMLGIFLIVDLILILITLTACTPLPAQAEAIQNQVDSPQALALPYATPTQNPAPTRAHPRPTETPEARVVIVIVHTGYVSGTVNLRSCPSTTCQVVETLKEGNSLHLKGEGNQPEANWLWVQTPTHAGYIYAKFVEVQP